MDLQRFKHMIADGSPPPPELGPGLAALWQLAKGDWAAAHRIAQDTTRSEGDWVHAHLHRVEGDLANAAYWYRRAGRPVSSEPLQDEWDTIAATLLEATPPRGA